MPRKPKTNNKAAQARYREEMRQYRLDVKAYNERRNKYLRAVATEKREKDSQLKKLIRLVRGKGIYEPKSSELTRYRRSRLTQISNTFGDFLDPAKFFYVKPKSKKHRKRVLERAEGLGLKSTREGLFVRREGHTKATLKYNAKRDELYVERTGKTKMGATKGRRYRSIMPLASVDELEMEKDRLRNMAKDLGPRHGNERYAWKISEEGSSGFGKKTYVSLERLLEELAHYKATLPQNIQFMRHVEIEITESASAWHEEHPPAPKKHKKRKVRSAYKDKGRY